MLIYGSVICHRKWAHCIIGDMQAAVTLYDVSKVISGIETLSGYAIYSLRFSQALVIVLV